MNDFDFCRDTLWGEIVLYMASKAGSKQVMRDEELDQTLFMSGQMYTAVQLGMLDGPGRYRPKDDPIVTMPAYKRGLKASLTKRQRRALRKAKRKANREGLSFNEGEFIRVEILGKD